MVRRLVGMLGAALLVFLGAVAAIDRLGRSWEGRVAVQGHSMEPTLCSGDWLLVDPYAYVPRTPRVGELAVARDPRDPRRVIVKRVAAVGADERVALAGDHPAHADDATRIGAVDRSAILGRPWFRYWPLAGFGRIA